MVRSPFCLAFDRLPETLPIFPLPNAVALPGCQLPLNIFEPRYLNMVMDALASHRMIGMVQPCGEVGKAESAGHGLAGVGTAGRIMSFTETDDGRILIALTGVCRFDLIEEIATTRGYRRFKVSWSRWSTDYDVGEDKLVNEARQSLILQSYLQRNQIETDWAALEQLPLCVAVNILIGQLPLEMEERQRLVESVGVRERLDQLIELVQHKLMESTTTDRPH